MRPLSREIENVLLQVAAGAQDSDAGAALQLAYDRRGVGNYGEAVAIVQQARQLQHRRAALEKYGVSIEDQLLCFARDGSFFLAIAAHQGLVRRLKLRARHSRHRAAVRADQHTFSFESRQVAANRRRRHLQRSAQLRSVDRALRGKNLANAKPAFFSKHGDCWRPLYADRNPGCV